MLHNTTADIKQWHAQIFQDYKKKVIMKTKYRDTVISKANSALAHLHYNVKNETHLG